LVRKGQLHHLHVHCICVFCGQYRFVSFFPFVHPISVLTISNYFSWIALSPFSFLFSCSLPCSSPLFLPFLPPPCSSLPPSPPPVCDESFSWRCCSIASVCPACCANPPPHQALGPSTHTKYFYLFIQFHGLSGGNIRLDRS